ncbi:uncharacterized protein LOC141617068 [Silene latifolia]|uniref:uncharacterized protein LOC141617068 n=1 Tax=Silene latifolia TaxID=37657 RepID=UPI003D774C0C
MLQYEELREIAAEVTAPESSKTAELRSFNLSKEVSAVPEITVTTETEWKTVGAKAGTPLEQPRVKIETGDVQGELEFWSSSVFCFVLGANPPNHVMDGYVRRIWKELSIDKVTFQANGVCIVRFSKQEDKESVLQSEQLFFDNKPFIIRDWQPDVKCVKDKPDLVRIWVRLYNLDLKFWGKALPKIVSMIGTPIRPDRATEKKEYLEYARFMVEVKLGHLLPDKIEFIDDKDVVQLQEVSYEWKPLVCSQCSCIGHDAAMCRKRADEVRKKPAQKVWRPKAPVPVKPAAVPVQVAPVQCVEPVQETMVLPQINPPVMVTPLPFRGKEMASPASLVHRMSRLGRGSSQGGPTVLEVMVNCIRKDLQVIHAQVTNLVTGFGWTCSLVYGCNADSDRVALWDSLIALKANVHGPWLVMGDFNNVLYVDERIGSQVTDAEVKGFQNCVDVCGLYDLVSTGAYFTWNNKQEGDTRVYSRIDRVLANDDWILNRPNGVVSFLPEGLYDHSPCLIELGEDLVKKLKHLKHPLKKLNNGRYGDIENTAMLQAEERVASDSYKELDAARLLFIAQKAKVQWVNLADDNTRYFHSTIKARRAQNKVLKIKDMHGVICTEGSVVNAEHARGMVQQVTDDEIRAALFSIPVEKAPGPDGYSAGFFRDAYDIIGGDVLNSVKEFFSTGRLLQQVNATVLTLIPKVDCPNSVHDFRPIVCCNVIYKCISKIICKRLSGVLMDIVSMNQSAFIKDREIVDNILICQVLVRLYGRKSCTPRAMLKIDLKKAYDSIEWAFLRDMLIALEFPDQMIQWIMVCVTTTSFTISLNGSRFGYFKGERGLRQGDPMSPLLFMLCLEYFSRILRVVTEKPEFRYHSLCRGLKLSHLAFADDLLLFCRADTASITIILRAFLNFSEASGLCMNKAKSDIYLNGVDDNLATKIIRLAGLKLGQFPFRYLGVPISSKRLSVADFNRVVDKIVARIRGWGAKHLSYAGRLVLVKAVLTQMHAYWARIFLLPKGVIHKVECICRNYLWAGHAEYKHSPPVAWETCCLPKEQGGLGIINCHLWNVALIGKYAWWIHSNKESLWIQSVHHIYIKQYDWWMYEPTQNSSWTWRQICKVKDMLKPGFLNGAWDGNYSIQKGYQWLLGPCSKKDWVPMVWNRVCVPKHNFSTWIYVQQRFLTQDRLQKFGVSTSVFDATTELAAGSMTWRCDGLDYSLEVSLFAEKAGGNGCNFWSHIQHLGL